MRKRIIIGILAGLFFTLVLAEAIHTQSDTNHDFSQCVLCQFLSSPSIQQAPVATPQINQATIVCEITTQAILSKRCQVNISARAPPVQA